MGWGVAGPQPMSTAVHRSLNKLWRSNSIFNLWVSASLKLFLRYTHKSSYFKTSGFKTSCFQTSETSGLQNVRFTKRQVYKTSGLQNVRFTKRQVYKTSGLQNVRSSKRPVAKNIHKYYVLVLQPCLQAKWWLCFILYFTGFFCHISP